MSFLAGRLAAKEGAYFLDQSKQAITRLAPRATTTPPPTTTTSSSSVDVSPEVLRHSLPPSILRGGEHEAARSAISGSTRWSFRVGESAVGSSVSADALSPLRGFVAMPQVTFGPRRWELPQAGGLVTASTANELRRDQYAHFDPKKLKDVAEGLAQIGKALQQLLQLYLVVLYSLSVWLHQSKRFTVVSCCILTERGYPNQRKGNRSAEV